MKTFFYFISVFFFLSSFSAQTVIKTCQNGDLIFIKLTHTPQESGKYNCLGIVFIEQGTSMVYYVDGQLKKCSYEAFLKLSANKKYDIKRLSDKELLSDDVISTMRTYAAVSLGTPEDGQKSWGDEALYNSEFIWKLYKQCVGVPLCRTKEIKDANGRTNDKTIVWTELYKSEWLTDLEGE
jgi:hypothetical protein